MQHKILVAYDGTESAEQAKRVIDRAPCDVLVAGPHTSRYVPRRGR